MFACIFICVILAPWDSEVDWQLPEHHDTKNHIERNYVMPKIKVATMSWNYECFSFVSDVSFFIVLLHYRDFKIPFQLSMINLINIHYVNEKRNFLFMQTNCLLLGHIQHSNFNMAQNNSIIHPTHDLILSQCNQYIQDWKILHQNNSFNIVLSYVIMLSSQTFHWTQWVLLF